MDSVTVVLIASALLLAKHFVADFPLQTANMLANKGTYGHMGGITHAAIHAGLSVPILMLFTGKLGLILALAVAEFIVHYHIDWGKETLTKRLRLTPVDRTFWALIGLDQLAHHLTLIAMVWALVSL